MVAASDERPPIQHLGLKMGDIRYIIPNFMAALIGQVLIHRWI